jgi:hypothetical protein
VFRSTQPAPGQQAPVWHWESDWQALPLGILQAAELLLPEQEEPAQQSVGKKMLQGEPAGMQQTLFVQKPTWHCPGD